MRYSQKSILRGSLFLYSDVQNIRMSLRSPAMLLPILSTKGSLIKYTTSIMLRRNKALLLRLSHNPYIAVEHLITLARLHTQLQVLWKSAWYSFQNTTYIPRTLLYTSLCYQAHRMIPISPKGWYICIIYETKLPGTTYHTYTAAAVVVHVSQSTCKYEFRRNPRSHGYYKTKRLFLLITRLKTKHTEKDKRTTNCQYLYN